MDRPARQRPGASARVPEAVSWLAERGFEPQFGARPLRRAIQREVDNRLSRLMLDGRVRSGQRVRVVVKDGDLEVEDVREAASAQA
jgi:ATP-dependent Clp protease ATP-binding subunit ClpC